MAALSLGLGLGGCSSLDSNADLNPEGPPEVKQVFLFERDMSTYVVDHALAYGTHPEVPGDDGQPGTAGTVTTGLANYYWDDYHFVIYGSHFQIVVDELLDGRTIEQFYCACNMGACPAGSPAAVTVQDTNPLDGVTCSGCADDTSTAFNETDRCIDVNFDGIPDAWVALPDLVNLQCGTTGDPDQFLDMSNDESWAQLEQLNGVMNVSGYKPSGNQLIPVASGTHGLGPAIYMFPPLPLPTNASCTLTLTGAISDKEGTALTLDPITFGVEPLALGFTSPGNGEADIDPDGAFVEMDFNTVLDEAAIADADIQVRVQGTTVDLPGTITFDVELDPYGFGAEVGNTIIFWDPATPLLPDTTYEVTVTAGVVDTFGQAFPSTNNSFTFTTCPAAGCP